MVENKYTHINLEYMELMADGDDEMKQTMIEMLLEDLPIELQKMKDCSDKSDFEELSKVSHKMKSTLSFVGNDAMTRANKQVEKAAKEGKERENISQLIQLLLENCKTVIEELNTELSKL